MAKVDHEQDLLLKKRARRRLVGSIVLVIIAIIVLPVILERAPKQDRKEIEIIIPSEKLLDESSAKITPKPDTLDHESSISEDVAIENNFLDSENKTYKKNTIKAEQKAEKNSEFLIKPKKKKKEQVDTSVKKNAETNVSNKQIVSKEKFVVQLGAFSDQNKARHQLQSLISNGIKKAYTETVKNKNTEVTRVRIGPFLSRKDADKEQKKLRRLGIKGVVLTK